MSAYKTINRFQNLLTPNGVRAQCNVFSPKSFSSVSRWLPPPCVGSSNKLDGKCCNGAHDFIIEIVSPGNASDDYIRKLYCYRNAGIREYWIIDPRRKIVTINYFEGEMLSVQYSFNSVVKVNIYDDLFIDFFEILKILNS